MIKCFFTRFLPSSVTLVSRVENMPQPSLEEFSTNSERKRWSGLEDVAQYLVALVTMK